MDDSFHEIIVKGQRTKQDGLKIVGLYVAALAAWILTFMFGAYLGMLMPLLLVGIGYGLFYLVRGFSREFEYTVTNGDLDIDMIVAQRKRKRVFSGSARQFESMAPLSNHDQSQTQAPGTAWVIDCRGLAAARNQVTNRVHYRILAEFKGKRVQVLFTPDEFIVNQLKKFNPARILLG
ncbi:MAG: hypothetical protein PHC86_01495 [Eubacteriales bacterium]|nr:hypothetical protein [Eubacteriales bacterium]